jgi:UDP-N-acetylglucosamine 2-epimerase (non-hydrolysing)
MKIVHVVGARPNFIKVSPVFAALANRSGLDQMLVHTGQHYDANMSDVFFDQLELPKPDTNLGVGSGTHAWQTANIMIHFERVILEQLADLVLVYGDVNSTVAASLVCSKMNVPVGHVEAGLRSFDRTMPEEINRLLTDRVADLLFTPSKDGDENLLREGVQPEKIFLVGNVMIDTLIRLLPQADSMWVELRDRLSLGERFGLVTLHRPSNVDDATKLGAIVTALDELSRQIPLIFPVHPRTHQRIASLNGQLLPGSLRMVKPLSYLEFLALMQRATLVITDSGGIQEETTFLGVPCLTLRENTERPVTVQLGTNILVGQDIDRLRQEADRILRGEFKQGQIPPLWDGQAGERIASIIVERLPMGFKCQPI